MLTKTKFYAIVSFVLGVWSNGMTEVSKTFSEGSIPSTPVPNDGVYPSFFCVKK